MLSKSRQLRLRAGRIGPAGKALLAACWIVMLTLGTVKDARAQDATREYRIKAAFLYNFLLFVKRAETSPETVDEIVIAIIGDDPFGTAFDRVEGERVGAGGPILRVRRFASVQEMLDQTGNRCRLAFFSFTDAKRLESELVRLKESPVLTVGESYGFLSAGGMLNLVTVHARIRWEINRSAVRRARLEISPQLLRNAVRVFEPEDP